MTSNGHLEELKRLRQADQNLRFVVKRLPGINTVEELERIAYVLEDTVPEDAEFVRRLAKRLEELRVPFYGKRKPYKRYLVEEQ